MNSISHIGLKAVLTASLLACSLSLGAQDRFTIDGLTYAVTTGNTVAVVGSEDSFEIHEYVIPATVTGVDGMAYTVTAIGDSAFYSRSFLQNVQLPTTITSIGRMPSPRAGG